MLAQVQSLALLGLEVRRVLVEVDLSSGLPLFGVVGLPDTSVRESRDRVRTALRNSGFNLPVRRITVNLAPAHMPKAGPSFDLPIALAILAASGRVPSTRLEDCAFAGELSLNGELRGVQGGLCLATAPAGPGEPPVLVLPAANGAELGVVATSRQTLLARDLCQVVAWLQGKRCLSPVPQVETPPVTYRGPDLADVLAQPSARRALEIAAAGRHNLLLIGPPGTGKTMLAARLPSILPLPTEEEKVEIARVYSASGLLRSGSLPGTRPFRAPHHTISPAGMVGGGASLLPGEVTLSHQGVLFLDELAEYRTDVLAALREPMEERWVTIRRGTGSLRFPADFQVVATTNPCPCGWLGDLRRLCSCTKSDLQRYRRRLSGPLLDRFDMFAGLQTAPEAGLQNASGCRGESSSTVLHRVMLAWERQRERTAGRRKRNRSAGEAWANSRLSSEQMHLFCRLDNSSAALLETAASRLTLSARGVDRVLRVARTIADLAGRENLCTADLAEAISYRQ